ncbi:MAG: response regulator transcription factor [Verrucomicrobia bacterium]|nr:response regulator transcription factor [Verrucomicrobiota bacterium]MDA1048151.1 response regulator transcription factor [Verrucomicrobiota bacterium]
MNDNDYITFNSSGHSILIIDDEPDLCELIEFQLQKEGFRTSTLSNPLEAIGHARDFDPDLIILDVMMPELDGLRLCSMLKVDSQLKKVPILFLTARSDADERVKGFERGADDYLTKPFDNRELVARSKVILSRTLEKKSIMAGRLKADGIVLDPETHEVFIEDERVELTHTEFRLLHLMMERVGRVQSRENLLVNVWNYDTDIETRTVDNHVGRLRGKMGSKGEMIKTVRGVGYKLSID